MAAVCPFFYGMNLRPALAGARQLGCYAHNVAGTGDIRVEFPNSNRPERVDGRRKDAPLHLVRRLIRLWTERQQSAPPTRVA